MTADQPSMASQFNIGPTEGMVIFKPKRGKYIKSASATPKDLDKFVESALSGGAQAWETLQGGKDLSFTQKKDEL